ncbi:MAG TPA: tryptophan--tRNA ligase [Candidatus Paceibacterota bacterium]|uniref:Tryptophan--tRNA ligase n=1 Tax=Candidatus Adlerbacteria bacterium RIFCSPLOWO2_01_FULL_51_16 TaxID=1797243 RepID=A0A1F4XEH8_9BACT|nr:MAG: tryptophan--tRNA ligase [Candidatus Adlerbacteria bacterium RIFCSPLOWO2_01_FULL_51_16]HXK31185.1 tryptophan--tRNA ligase [Candidatus Paceibacterota bacterium]
MATKKRLLTGLQPSGPLHVGNYLGSLKPFVEAYGEYESFLMIADYHALTSLKSPKTLQENTLDLVASYVAAGVNPGQAIIFKQSDIPEHTELAWIFETLVTVPFLMQAHAYKDKVAKGLEANAGLFNYPMLMAADILLYDTDVVPVGEDQRQHVEYAREAAAKFNTAYGETFKEPAERILGGVGVIPGIDGKKMSKSYNNTIPLFGSDAEIRTAVMSITTDSTPAGQPLNPSKDTTFALHRHFTPNLPELDKLYQEGKITYKESKELLAENIIKAVAPMRDRKAALDPVAVRTILKDGAEVARDRASKKMKEVREKIGVTL